MTREEIKEVVGEELELKYLEDVKIKNVVENDDNTFGYRNRLVYACVTATVYDPKTKTSEIIENFGGRNSIEIENFAVLQDGELIPADGCLPFVRSDDVVVCPEAKEKITKEVKRAKKELKDSGIQVDRYYDTWGFYGWIVKAETIPLPTGRFNSTTQFVSYSDNGIKLQTIQRKLRKVKINKELTFDDYVSYTLKSKIEIDYMTGVKSHSFNRGKPVEKEPMQIFNLNSSSIRHTKFTFEDSHDLADFMSKRPEVFKKLGMIDFLQSLQASNMRIRQNSVFLVYLLIYAQYPAVELLLKMEHYSLMSSIMLKLLKAESGREIGEIVANLSSLINETSKGSLALRFPTYIANYLKSHSCSIEVYHFWADLYELENLSKETFEEIVNSFDFLDVSCVTDPTKLLSIVKYGFTTKQVLKYLRKERQKAFEFNKQFNEDSYDPNKMETEYFGILNLLNDYLTMMDILGVEATRLPQNLKKQHDELVTQLNNFKVEAKDLTHLKEIAETLAGEKLSDNFVVKVPSTYAEFIEEGVNMNHCIGGYYNRALEGSSIIFFIRKASNVDKSYITVETNPKGVVNQIAYKNSQNVYNKEELEIATKFAKLIVKNIMKGNK